MKSNKLKSNKLITRNALMQLMLAMVASGKAHRSDFESMDPNEVVLLAANLIDPSMLQDSSHHVQWTVSHGPTGAVSKQQPVDEDPGDVSKWNSETETVTQFVWHGVSLEKIYRYLQLTMDDTEEDSAMLGPYSSYDVVELLCTFFEQDTYWFIRNELFVQHDFDPENTQCEELLEYLGTTKQLPDVASLFTNHVFYTDEEYSDVINKVEAEIKEQNQIALIEATAKLLYIESSFTVDTNVLVAHGMKSTVVKTMPSRKRRQLAWDLNCCDERERFIEQAYLKLGIDRV